MKKEIAVLIDLKNSRGHSTTQRLNLQKYIMDLVNHLNEIFDKSLIKKVVFNGGDCVQGVFDSLLAAFLYVRLFKMLMYPHEIYIGIGFERIEIKIDELDSFGQDGTAYHLASAAIDVAKDSAGHRMLLSSNRRSDVVVNAMFSMLLQIFDGRSVVQNDAALLIELLSPISINNILRVDKIRNLFLFVKNKRSEVNEKTIFADIDMEDFDVIEVNVAHVSDNRLFSTQGKIRGLVSHIAKITDRKEQTIGKNVKNAKTYQERNFAIAILLFLDNA